MREEFEKLPSIAAELENSDGELYWCDKQNQYRNNRVFQDSQTGWMNGAWYAWQAKAQAVPEVKLSHCVTLTCAQLREAFMFGAPDGDDQEQLETEMTIVWSEDGHSGKGYYCYYSELPEEGAIFLDEMIETQEQSK